MAGAPRVMPGDNVPCRVTNNLRGRRETEARARRARNSRRSRMAGGQSRPSRSWPANGTSPQMQACALSPALGFGSTSGTRRSSASLLSKPKNPVARFSRCPASCQLPARSSGELSGSPPIGCISMYAQRRMSLSTPHTLLHSRFLDMAGEWPFAPLVGIIQCPTLRRDGSLLDVEGYDEATGLALVNSLEMPPIAATPDRADAEAALMLLNDLLTEFPFVDEASWTVALSKILTPVLRGAMAVAPMHLATAPRPGTGKSFLDDIASMIATGDHCAVKAASPSPEETEKRLIGAALAGHPIIALDNCRDVLEGDFLCQITERPLMEVRALGKSDQYRIPNAFTFFANGNNVRVADDMVRRTIRCGMDANCENPEKRAFKSDPLAMIRADRGKYVAACLTIARTYIAAGRPNPLPPLPSFEGWSAIVRDPLVWLGYPDPVETMESLRNEDPKGGERHAVFEAWKSAIGVGKHRANYTSEIINQATHHTSLRDALLAIAQRRYGNGEIDPKALGKWLGTQEKNIAAKCKLLADRTDKTRPKWYLDLVVG